MTDETKVSVNLGDMTLDELVQLQQGLGHDLEALRQKRIYLNGKIAERIARGERNGAPDTWMRPVDLEARAAKAKAEAEAAGQDGTAPGAQLRVATKK